MQKYIEHSNKINGAFIKNSDMNYENKFFVT